MRGLGILILAIVFFYVVWPYIARWLKKKAMDKAEDYMRAQMGMPPRDRKRKNSRYKEKETQQEYYGRQRRNPFGSESYNHEPIIPKEYAEDVEFTETVDYSESRLDNSTERRETYHESQISDAEFVEIKKPRSK